MEQEPTNLQIAMDDATAARITAWVLGEASAFEAEQLEELCRTHSQWRSYEQSRRALHGFIAEAEKSPVDDESWKISPEKRDALLEKISRPTNSQKKHWKVSRQSLLRAACITVFFGLSGLYISQSFVKDADLAMLPKTEESVQGLVQAERGLVVDGKLKELEGEVQQQEDIVTEARKQRDLFLRRAPRVIADESTDTAASTASFTYASPQKLAPAGGQSTDSRLDAPQEVASASEYAPLAASTSKPSAPSASNAKVIASSEPSRIEIPVPSVNEVQPSAAFGDGDDYGNGFGSIAGEGKELEVTSAAPTDRVSQMAQSNGKDREIHEFEKKGSKWYGQDEGLKADLKPGSRQASNMDASPQEEKIQSSVATRESSRRGVSGSVLSGKNANQKVSEFDDRSLSRADGLLALGKFDESKKVYEDILRKDPTNADARRGLEGAQSAKAEDYKSAYDHARAKLLADADQAWELSVLTPLIQEKPTSEDPYSTFSLRVSDASFQLACQAIQKGNRPQPNEIRSEDFYNAFDYGDAAAAEGEPVVCAMEQSTHPFAPQRHLLRLSMAVGASGRSAAQPLHLTLVVDQSGSMEREDRHEIMKASVAELGKLLTDKDRVSVIGFSRTPRLLGENIVGNDLAKWQSLVTTAPNDGGTNLEQALLLGETIAIRHKNAVAQNRVLLVTDGAANLGNANPENLAARVKEMRQRGLCFDVVGVGTGGENDLRLLELSRHGNGRYQVLQNVGDAKETFARQLAGAFRPAAENVKVQVRFNDKRVKSFLLHGFEKDRLHTEDFRNDKVDAAEIAANEAGNALYQFQVIPDGEGDVGEASVRFRDPASGMMVERKWTIPWQPAAPAFDQASPSLQLAGLSLQAAQFLQGSPLATPSTSPYFSTVEENVRRQYGNQVNVAKLLEMLRLIK